MTPEEKLAAIADMERSLDRALDKSMERLRSTADQIERDIWDSAFLAAIGGLTSNPCHASSRMEQIVSSASDVADHSLAVRRARWM